MNSASVQALHAVVRRLQGSHAGVRPERLSGIHNPWGAAAGITDPWAFLAVCEDDAILALVQQEIGEDVILWDSCLYLDAADYTRYVAAGREGPYWPVTPLAGAVVLVLLDDSDSAQVRCVPLAQVDDAARTLPHGAPLYVVRYMPATSRFERDPRFAANWLCMEQQPLINHANRPLWLVRGDNRAGNDLVTGFAPAVPHWAGGHS